MLTVGAIENTMVSKNRLILSVAENGGRMKTIRRKTVLLITVFAVGSCGLTFAQVNRLPPPDFVRPSVQPDSPLELTIDEGREYGGNFQPVNYSIRNTSDKSIRAVIVTGFPKEPNHVTLLGSLRPGSSRALLYGDLSSRKQGQIITLLVEFVLFTDGSKWGSDRSGESAFLYGLIAGQERFYRQIKKVLDSNDQEALSRFLSQPVQLPEFGNPNEPIGKRTRNQDGFARGYQYWRNSLAFDSKNRGDLQAVPSKVADLGRDLGLISEPPFGVRRISRTAEMNEPIKFVGMRLDNKPIAFDENFSVASNWLQGLSLRVKNDSGKTIEYFSITLDFPETTETGSMIGGSIQYGQFLLNSTTIGNKAEGSVGAGETFEMVLNEKHYVNLKNSIDSRQPFDNLTRVNIRISSIYFDDGTKWGSGQYFKQDPEDPKRWIPADKKSEP